METFESIDPKSAALQEIYHIMERAMRMGANDFEPTAFMQIISKVQDGSFTPQEGVRKACEIADSKQDYH